MTGIYKITNNINGKIYIGQASHIASRWSEHLYRPFNKNDKTYDSHLYRAIRKYGIENFSFSIVEQCKQDQLDEKEVFWVDFYQSNNKALGYNLTAGGNGSRSRGIFLDADIANEIKHLLMNTNTKQWDIANQFNVKQAVVSYINHGRLWHDDNLSYPLRGETKSIHICIDCGQEISRGSTRCVQCSQRARRGDAAIPSLDELKEELLKNNGNFTEVGRHYNTSDNVVRGWCKKYNISYYSKDYAKPKNKDNNKKNTIFPIQQIDLCTKEVIATFSSAAEARRATGILHILDVCYGDRKSAGGFDWKQIKNE